MPEGLLQCLQSGAVYQGQILFLCQICPVLTGLRLEGIPEHGIEDVTIAGTVFEADELRIVDQVSQTGDLTDLFKRAGCSQSEVDPLAVTALVRAGGNTGILAMTGINLAERPLGGDLHSAEAENAVVEQGGTDAVTLAGTGTVKQSRSNFCNQQVTGGSVANAGWELVLSYIEALIDNKNWIAAYNCLLAYIDEKGEDYWAKNYLKLVQDHLKD